MKSEFARMLAGGLLGLCLSAGLAIAGPLQDRIDEGKPIRIGFANEIPWAYPGEGNEPKGFVNAHVIGLLNSMGYDKIEPVVTEWGGLIPGLRANRFDIITGGMYILKERCENIAFSDPMGTFGDAFIVPAGNPKNINTFADIEEQGAVMVTGAGYNSIKKAKDVGIPDSNIMEVPGPTEILAAVKAGRADAGAVTYFTALNLAKESGGDVDVSDTSLIPESYMNWVGIGFREEDRDFLEKFNAAQAEYLGSDDMLSSVAEYGYTEAQLPGDVTTEWACNNR